MTDKTGGPAFPSQDSLTIGDVLYRGEAGMTLRDYFAAKAMNAILADRDEVGTLVRHGYGWVAQASYEMADAMLAERAK